MAFALFSGVFIAGGIPRLVFAALLVVWVAQLARDVLANRRGTPTLMPPDEPLGPTIVGNLVMATVFVIALGLVGTLGFESNGYPEVTGVCAAIGLTAGWVTKSALLRRRQLRG